MSMTLQRRLPEWLTAMFMIPAVVLISILFAQDVLAQQASKDVVALVNGEPITRQKLDHAVVERNGLDVLDNMINRHLILQECNHRGITVTKEEVTAEIQRLAEKFGLSMESYLQLLQDERDITPNQYSREVIWPMLALRRLVADQVEVTQEEFDRAFLSQYGEAVKCRLIMVASRSKAETLHAQAAANPNRFAQLAKQYSEDETSASVGGLIPPIRRYSGDTRLEEAAFGLQNGQVSDILSLGDQWIILQAVRKIPAHQPPAQAMPTIREQITDRIRDQKTRAAATELFARLQQEAQVIKVLGDEALMKKYPGAAAVINGQQISISLVADECVKRYGKDILEGEINRTLLTQALRKANKQITQTDVDQEIAKAAISYGFVRADGQPDLDAWKASVTEEGKVTWDVYLADAVWPSVALKKLVEDDVSLTEQDLQQGFESNYGPRVEILAIVLSDQRSAQKIWEMARDNPTEEFFASLAEQYSVEPVSASNRGKVPPIRKYGGQPAIEREAFSLKPGELSGIVATGGKYIIMWCQGFTEPVVHDLAVVRDELIRDLTESKTAQAMTKRFDELYDAAEIDNFLAATKDVPQVAQRPRVKREN